MRSSGVIALLLLLTSAAMAQQDTLIIHFDLDRTKIRSADAALLDSFVTTLRLRPILLTGHTDAIGSDKHNNRLALARALAVRHYLQTKGVPDSLFKSLEGHGSHRPRDPLDPSLNRRVEIVVNHLSSVPADIWRPDEPARDSGGLPTSLQEAFRDTSSLTGKNIILRNVNFYGDRHVPLPESYRELTELRTVMQHHPRMIIQIQGYVCCLPDGMDGRDADNGAEGLSVQRAKFVCDYLASQGIDASRMSFRGFGASGKIYPLERDEREKRENRRVEIKVIRWR